MTASRPDSSVDSPEASMRRLLRRFRRALVCRWSLVALARGLLVASGPAILLTWWRQSLQIRQGSLLAAYCVGACTVALLHLWLTRSAITRPAERLDEELGAGGRVETAKELLDSARSDPFSRLVLRDTMDWVERRRDTITLRRWPVEVYALPPAALLFYLALRFS